MTLLLAACSGGDAPPPSVVAGGPTTASATPVEPTATSPASDPEPSASPTPPSAPPAVLPPGVPATYGRDVEPGDLPFDRLVPSGAEVTGTAFPGETVAIATWSVGDDPFQREQGLVVWRRSPGADPPWTATFALRDPPRAGVLGIRVDVADATGDGEPDALAFESVGGSGACGTWRLIALGPAADAQTFARDLCDASVEFSSDPVGLRVIESVFGPDDPHCCPSGTKTSTLEWNGSRWRITAVDRSDTD